MSGKCHSLTDPSNSTSIAQYQNFHVNQMKCSSAKKVYAMKNVVEFKSNKVELATNRKPNPLINSELHSNPSNLDFLDSY